MRNKDRIPITYITKDFSIVKHNPQEKKKSALLAEVKKDRRGRNVFF
jgi:hypothetical protein